MSKFAPASFARSVEIAGVTDDPPVLGPSVTLLTSPSAPLVKRIYAEDGKIRKTPMAAFQQGEAETVQVETAEKLATLLSALSSYQAISTGVLVTGTRARIGVRGHLKDSAIARTVENFHFPKGPGWLLVDYDDKTMPDHVRRRVAELDGPLGAIYHIWPEACHAEQLIRPSSSDGLSAPGVAPIESSARHGYFLVEDISRSREILEVLHARAWVAGLGWIALSKSGAKLDRSIIDVSVGSPERIIFEGPPLVEEPVVRNPRAPLIKEGMALKPPSLTDDIRLQAHAARDAARECIEPHAKAQEKAHIDARAADLVSRLGLPPKASRRIVERLLQTQILDDDTLLDLADGQQVRVGDLLDGPLGRHRMSMPDPVEGLAYGADKATLFIDPRPGHKHDTPCIVSHAHGIRLVYRFARFTDPTLPPLHPMPPTGDMREPAIRAMRERIAQWGRLSNRFARLTAPALRGQEEETGCATPLALQKAGQEEPTGAPNAAVGASAAEYEDDVPPTEATPPIWLMSGAQGIGKTAAVVGRNGEPGLLHGGRGFVSVMYSIDHAKSAEACRDYQDNRPRDRSSPRAIHLRGRGSSRPDGTGLMCQLAKQAASLAQTGVSVRNTLCKRCPFAADCIYLKQEQDLEAAMTDPDGAVVFAVHDHALVKLPGDLQPARVVFDERPRDFFHRAHVVPLSDWGRKLLTVSYRPDRSLGSIADKVAELNELIEPLRQSIRTAVTECPDRGLDHINSFLQELLQDKETAVRLGCQEMKPAEIVRHAAQLLRQWRDWSLDGEIKEILSRKRQSAPKLADVEMQLSKLLDDQAPSLHAALPGIFEAVAVELEQKHGPALRAVHQLRLDGQDCIVAEVIALPTFPSDVPLLHLDGTGDEALAQAWFGAGLKHYRYPVERLGTAMFVDGHKFSTVSLTGRNPVTGKPWNAKKAENIRTHWREVFSWYPGSCVIMTKSAVEAFGSLKGHVVTWFGGLRGQNRAEGCDTAIVIGRQQPTVRDVERMARAIAVVLDRSFEPLVKQEGETHAQYLMRRSGLRLRDGTGHAIAVAYHPDPTAEMVLRQVRDAETTQAADRVRAMFAPKRLIIAGASVPDVTFDRVVSWDEFKVGGSRLERTWERKVLPLAPAELVRVYPDLWANPKAVARDEALQELRAKVQSGYVVTKSLSGSNLPLETPLQHVRYTRPSTGSERGKRARHFEALVVARPDEVASLIAARLGRVIRFDILPLASTDGSVGEQSRLGPLIKVER